MNQSKLILGILITIIVILAIGSSILIANEFNPSLKPAITDDSSIMEGGKDASYLIPGFRSIDFEGLGALSVYSLTPFLVLYLGLRDYFNSRAKREKLSFAKSLIKGVVVSIVIAIIIWVSITTTCSGEGCRGAIASPIIAVSGSFLSLIIVSIAYSKSKKSADIAVGF